MKTRYIWLLLGLAFSITLAVIVGQRLSSEAMAVMVGVVAGVAASIPTSLIIVWLATRSAGARSAAETERRNAVSAQSAPPEPRIMVLTPPPSQRAGGFPNAVYPSLPYPAEPRQFKVIGGADVSLDDAPPAQEEVWHR